MVDRRHHTQWAAQFAVASELCKRGYEVGFTMGNNTPVADLFVTAPGGEIFLVDVKGQATRNFWRIKQRPIIQNLYFVLCYVGDEKNRFFVMSHATVDQFLEEYKRSGVKYDERFSGMNWTTPIVYENKWELLPQ